MRATLRTAAVLAGVLAAGLTAATPALAGEDGDGPDRTLFLTSATEDAAGTRATLPVHHGVAGGRAFEYVVTESSDRRDARRRGVNLSAKLANARGTAAVQQGRIVDGRLHVAAGVDFGPALTVAAGPTGFPPAAASPGAVGEAGYSPLVELPDGTVLNAPHVANASGDHDRLVGRDRAGRTATFAETEGRYGGKVVRYLSFEATVPTIAALERATVAPALDAAPGLGSGDRDASARSAIAPFANGRTGAGDPDRQGLASALLDGLDPLNVVDSTPRNGRYSPLWDVHATVWTPAAIAAGDDGRQERFDRIRGLAGDGLVTGLGGAPWGPTGAVVTCPIVSVG